MPTSQISTFDQLRSFITTNFPDNNSGLVDPEDVRVALRSFVDIQSLRNDLMTANLSPDQAAVWQELINKLDQIQRESKSGITGTATQSNAPTTYVPGTPLFESYIVRAPLTMPNSWGAAVTQSELDANYVFFDVRDGSVKKALSAKPNPDLSTVIKNTDIKSVSINRFNPSNIVANTLVNSSGVVQYVSGWSVAKEDVSDAIGQSITFFGKTGTGGMYYAFYNDANVLISFTPYNPIVKKTAVVPIDAKWLYINIKAPADDVSVYSQFRINDGINDLGYTPYSPEITKIKGMPIQGVGPGGTSYDQTLNKADNVQFNKVTATEFVIPGTLKKGTLTTPPIGLVSLEYWLDTTDSATNPIIRQKQ